MRLTASNFRALANVDWQVPDGVSVVVGPNGSGKTTLLDLVEILRHGFEHGFEHAIQAHGGRAHLRRIGASSPVDVRVDLAGVEVGACEYDSTLLEVAKANRLEVKGPGARINFALGDTRRVSALIQGYRFYRHPRTVELRQNGSLATSDVQLDPTATNLFSVLRNWRDKRADQPRWTFVIEALRRAMPEVFRDLEFEFAGQTVTASVIGPAFDSSLPIHLAADGLLLSMIHLCAAASAPQGGVIAIDEVENGLHPAAIAGLIGAFREWCSVNRSRVLLATHSPAVLNQFAGHEDHVFVLERGADTNPKRLTDLRDPEWLRHFALGDLYGREFGAQGSR